MNTFQVYAEYCQANVEDALRNEKRGLACKEAYEARNEDPEDLDSSTAVQSYIGYVKYSYDSQVHWVLALRELLLGLR
jgi:hypothetical protein